MFGHFIPENKSDSHPSVIVTVDCESTWRKHAPDSAVTEHRFRLCSARYCRIENGQPTRRKQVKFSTPQRFWEWLDQVSDKRRPTWLWCHNAAADLIWLDLATHLTGQLPTFSLNPGFAVGPATDDKPAPQWRGFACLGDPPTMLRLRCDSGWTLHVCDLMNWIPTALEEVGKWVGLDKVALPDHDAPQHEWYRRCDRDVEILEAGVLRLLEWVKQHDLGMFRWTVAMQSLAAYRHRFRDHKIAPHHVPEVDALERDGYFGGMTDLRFRGEVNAAPKRRGKQRTLQLDSPDQVCYGPVHELDCNGLYPSLYESTHVPTQLLAYSIPVGGAEPLKKTLAEDCVASVLVENHDDPFPLRCAGGVVWPKGAYWTTLCGPELLRAVRTNSIRACARWAQYELKRALQPFGSACLAGRESARQAGNAIEAQLWKSLGVSLHGKFGQKPSEWQDVPGQVAEAPFAHWWDKSVTTGKTALYRSLGYDVQVQGQGTAPTHSFPAIPAWISAAAREHMRRLAKIAGDWQVLYCCADALYVTDLGLQRLTEAGEVATGIPGKLRLVQSGASADFRGIGWLRLGLLYKRAGVPRNALPIGGEAVEFDRWSGLEKTLWSANPDVVTVERMQRAPPKEWWRGEVLTTGWIDRLTLPLSAAMRPRLGGLYPLPAPPRSESSSLTNPPPGL